VTPSATLNHSVHDHDRELLAKYDGRAPRYTSYPTAAQFSAAVGPEVYAGWLSDLSTRDAISLYAHIPFCQRLCWFCGCNTRVVRKADLISRYVQRLGEELAMLERAVPGRIPVAAIHLGGGSPNLLSPEDMAALFLDIRRVFAVQPEAEISVEADPVFLSARWVRAAAEHGVTRVSLGVQDLDPMVQRAVNRAESYDQVAQAVGWLRAAGIPSINLDLMYGLPHQTVRGVRATLDRILQLRPDRIALFGYAHVPWMKPHQSLIRAEDLPSAAERLDQASAAADTLVAAGYERVGLDHFARADDPLARARHSRRLHRNFQGYTTDTSPTLIAIGASGIGRLPQGYVQNQTTEIAWLAALDRGELPVARGVALTDEDRFRADIIESLMCHMGVDLAAACARHDWPGSALSGEQEAMREFERDGLITRSGDIVHVTERGRPFVRALCAVFDTYLTGSPARHSHVV